MYTYVTKELLDVVHATCEALGAKVQCGKGSPLSVFGHSMGGHGALMVALKNPGMYASASAFAPVCNPASGRCPWGDKAFTRYLGSVSAGKEYDSTELAKEYAGPAIDILVDQGLSDSFYKTQLETDAFAAAATGNEKISANVRKHEGYGHSYYFISTFMRDHIKFHGAKLKSLSMGKI